MGEPPMPRRGPQDGPRRVEIGRVRSVNPARREVRVIPRQGYERAFAGQKVMEFAASGGKHTAFAVQTVEEQSRYVKLTLAESVSTDDVASLKGAKILSAATRETPGDPFGVAPEECVGFAVRGPDGSEFGVVAGGFTTPAHGVVEIARAGGTTVLAPFVAEVFSGINLDARTIVLHDVDAHLVEQDSDGTMA